ncbi:MULTISPECIES: GNAT family N-acetyltransferase [Caballeronia]|uniref:GCN5 family acetyltransferase n=1 Tax=Caballeronia zhejiangensis TaxID=871203 RepID=A0A656QVJ8_9BURK|nr:MULTISPECIES: GNAT family N-acetyltransferase [Caballeronia]EKS71177.1 N-acetyltransferase GCN5 [Burkholderia sp. SJ98]KDR34197.1 GCN5 family acetyltransferase [Caballeronia zhejiangensis]MDR5766688.1 GNAT family N-acetyltransferase [Caballeronia sp. LZ028]MDR5788402.1 GNAT family N-acetyltransferase [Caballeronia sp. LP003]MDR5794860.1 GNAT family N-acetyltransferase [Caballeronia sp. LZ008]
MPDSNNNEVVEYRAFTLDDLPAAHALSASVKWRHRADDWRFAARIGSGFAAVDQNGALVGTALAFQFGADAATLGMFIVSPEHQRRGIGRGLLDRLRAKLGPRMLLIHASNEGKPLCVERGFETIDTIHQHQGAAFQPPLVSLPPGERLRPIGAKDTPRLAALASRASGLDRTELMPQLLDVASGIALDRDGELIGFALFRRFGDGHVIGPVVAPESADQSRAKALISYWLALNAGMFVRIDTPLRYGLSSWLEGLGLPLVDTIEQMALNGKPSTDATFTQFALTSQAVW